MIKEFRDFLLRGNIVEFAVAVIIAGAFGLVIESLTADIITPVIAMIGGKPDFASLSFTINDAQFKYGSFLTTVLAFVITAAAIFFIVVKPMQAMIARRAEGDEAPAAPPEDIELLREIRDLLRSR